MAVSLEDFDERAAEADAAVPAPPAASRALKAVPAPKPGALEPRRGLLDECAARALALWPRLSRVHLLKAQGDPWRIARLVARRTSEPPEVIVAMLTGQPILPAPSPSGLDGEDAEAAEA